MGIIGLHQGKREVPDKQQKKATQLRGLMEQRFAADKYVAA
ncbi:hypothetical protein ACQ4P5_15210 [Ralstonia sp. L16]